MAPLDDGFALDDPQIAVLTERQLFPEPAGQPPSGTAHAFIPGKR
ncbi:hypothetical protein VDQ83_16365 [Xanthomonas campestris pv. campestris]|nr:hypothetical protein [Xanthomonas campestris pv. campestris]